MVRHEAGVWNNAGPWLGDPESGQMVCGGCGWRSRAFQTRRAAESQMYTHRRHMQFKQLDIQIDTNSIGHTVYINGNVVGPMGGYAAGRSVIEVINNAIDDYFNRQS